MNAVAPPDVDAALGALLIERALLDEAGLARAQRVAAAGTERLHVVLAKLGLVPERDMAEALSAITGLAVVRPDDYPEEAQLDARISVNFLRDSRVFPLGEEDGRLLLAMADPLDDFVRRAVQLTAGCDVAVRIGVPADIEAAIERAFGGGRSSLGQIVDAIGDTDDAAAEDVQRLRDLAGEAPVIRIVNLLIARAVEARASDIHIEPFENRLRLRYRVDGELREVEGPPPGLAAAIVSRIKIMARLNIAERRLPQDGRIRLAVRGKEIDLRVATLPILHGESVVLRVLDRRSVVLDLAALGFEEDLLQTYGGVLERPNGILLVTGPTGSGKTTTLYASLMRINAAERKVLTVEDPVEYQLEGVNQVQVKPQIGLSFAGVLRSMLRQDPDIIMIGEIRDLETAQIAVQAALTGHLVLSTLHTNGAAATLTRLLDMGVEDYLVTSTLNGVLAQRLVRSLCPECREPHAPLAGVAEHLGLAPGTRLWRARGCAACGFSGYRGRTTICELLVVDDEVRRLILARAEATEIHRAARAAGMRTMYEDGLRKALAGITTLDEVLRVTRDA